MMSVRDKIIIIPGREKMDKVLFKNREEWRRWLEEHHDSASEVWLVYYKVHTKKESVRYEEAVEEALCFGWIDSKVKTIDDEQYMQRYTPRQDGSNWSESNKRRVRKLIETGRMTPAGMAKIDLAKRDGSWNRLDDIDREITVPEDLEAALAHNHTAKENFENYPLSSKKQYLWWLKSAKRAETREKRLREIVKRAEKNIKAGIN
jgi:uncharacterized protein YdeI (YjbR/CyaY-like superfamily)